MLGTSATVYCGCRRNRETLDGWVAAREQDAGRNHDCEQAEDSAGLEDSALAPYQTKEKQSNRAANKAKGRAFNFRQSPGAGIDPRGDGARSPCLNECDVSNGARRGWRDGA